MPIQQENIKLFASERMTDDDDGGGHITGNEIVDGDENNVFDDVSNLDVTYGRASIRKFFVGIDTADTDAYYGCNVIVAEPPSDPKVSVTLFTTNDWTDERRAARDYVERYVTEGPLSEMKLLHNHVAMSKLVLCYQRVAARLPEIGEVYVLSEEAADTVVASQFVLVTGVESEIVEYVDDAGTFQARQIVLSISDPLRRTYPGGEPRRVSSYQPATKIRRASAVDAARYASVLPLSQPAGMGSLQISVPSLFMPLIPGATGEAPVLDVQAGGTSAVTISGGTRTVSIPQVSHTHMTRITLQNRAYNYVLQLRPLPAPGSLVIHYRSQGKWYVIRDDDGTGTLTGDGAGTVTYSTGSARVTLLELPDVDTALLSAWGTTAHFVMRTAADIELPAWSFTAAHAGLAPNSVEIEWENAAGDLQLVTDDGVGNFVGAGVGRVSYATGQLYVRPVELPLPGTTPQLRYRYGTLLHTDFHPNADGNGFVELQVPAEHLPLRAGSCVVEWECIRGMSETEIAAQENS